MKNITHEGIIDLNGMHLPCYVLEDGTRVLSGRGMQEILKIVDEDLPQKGQQSGARLGRYLSQKTLKPFIFKGKQQGHFDALECYKGSQKINGYEATVLVDICDAFLEARKHISLSARQAIIADQAEILIRSFAKIGIIALVDEATGYEYNKEKYALQKILSAYIAKETLEWQLTFDMNFYKQVFRLWGIDFTTHNLKRKPQFIGNITNQFIYRMLPKGVLEYVKYNTPRTESGNFKYRFHQALTPEIGREHLKKQITEVTALMSISRSKIEFKTYFERRYGQLPMELE